MDPRAAIAKDIRELRERDVGFNDDLLRCAQIGLP